MHCWRLYHKKSTNFRETYIMNHADESCKGVYNSKANLYIVQPNFLCSIHDETTPQSHASPHTIRGSSPSPKQKGMQLYASPATMHVSKNHSLVLCKHNWSQSGASCWIHSSKTKHNSDDIATSTSVSRSNTFSPHLTYPKQKKQLFIFFENYSGFKKLFTSPRIFANSYFLLNVQKH